MSTQTMTWEGPRSDSDRSASHVDVAAPMPDRTAPNRTGPDIRCDESDSAKTTNGGSGCPIHNLLQWDATKSLASRVAVFAFGLLAYVAFFGTILYAMGFVNNLLVPKSISSGTGGRLVPSLLINGAFLALFAIQHTIMARKWFKQWVTGFIPPAMERSLFVLLASSILAGMFACWQPLPHIIWDVSNPILQWSLIAFSFVGWGIVLYSSFEINHFDLFGLRQVTINMMGQRYEPVKFRLGGLYRLVRHPLMLGFLIASWSTPLMTVGHLFYAAMITGYILFGTAIEERDLVADFGDDYLEYRRRVPGLLPIPRGKRGVA